MWTIEAKIFPIGETVQVGSHLFLEIFDDIGNRVLQINGLAQNRSDGSFDPTGDNQDQLVVEIGNPSLPYDPNYPDRPFFIGDSGGATRDDYPYDGQVLFSGNEEDVLLAISQIYAFQQYVNNQNFRYEFLSFNSNSIFSGLVSALAQVVDIDQNALASVIASAFNPVAVGTDIFQGNAWTVNSDDPATINGSIVTNTSTFKQGLIGTQGQDALYAQGGDDNLIGRKGSDILNGGSGKDTAHYDNTSEAPTSPDTSVTLNLVPERNYIEVKLGDFQNWDIEVVDRYNDTDKLVSVEKIVADASGIEGNTIYLIGDQTAHNVTGTSLEWNGQTYEFENFHKIKGDGGKQILDIRSTGFEYDLGGGDDHASIGGAGNVIYTGTGVDTMTINLRDGAQAYLADVSTTDTIANFGEVLTGGFKSAFSESQWTQTTDGVKYSVNQLGELVVHTLLQAEVFVANFNIIPTAQASELTAGIRIYELETGAWQFFRDEPPSWGNVLDGIETLAFQVKEIMRDANAAYDPLTLDLDGDGLELTTLSGFGTQFDLNGDSFAERTGWVNGDDGLLAIDLNTNGIIDSGAELFGSATLSGFAALAAYDTNTDGVVDVSDDDFGDLRIWRDLDQDGVTDTGELKTLTESNIASITVTPTSTTDTTIAGNTVTATGIFTRTDTTTGTAGDVILKNNTYDSKFLQSVTISTEAAAHLNLKGHGTLPDLQVAMTLDPDLIDVVDTVLPTLNTPDLDALRTAVMPLLTAWAATVDVPTGMPGTETRIDVPIKYTTDPANGPQIEDYGIQKTDGLGTYWVLASGDDVLDGGNNVIARPTYADILAQAGSWQTLESDVITFMERWTGLHIPLGLDGGEDGQDAIDGAAAVANVMWQEINRLAVRVASEGGLSSFFDGLSYNAADDKFVPTTDAQLIPMMQAVFAAAPGTSSGDAAHLMAWKPLIDVVLNDFERPSGLEVSYAYLFQNVVAAYENEPLAISLNDAAGAFSVLEDQIVAVGTTMTGTDDNDLFYLGAGNQTALGGKGPDSYVVGANFGQDVIDDTENTLGTDQTDTLRFAHVKSNEVTLTREDSDLIISVNGTTDQIRIVGEFATRLPSLTSGYLNETHGISEIVFADGVVWDKVDMARMASQADAGSTTLYGTGQIDFLDGGAGNDYLSGDNEGDVYIFGQGYGQDVIEDADAQFTATNTDIYNYSYTYLLDNPDIVNFKDINFDDVSFIRLSENDLKIEIDGTTDSLTVMDQFNASYTGVFGTPWFDRIEYFAFADGQDIGWQDLTVKMLADAATAGNDTILGFSLEDTLYGGAGDDILQGQLKQPLMGLF